MRDVDESEPPALRDGRARAWVPFLIAALATAVVFAWGARVYDDLPEVIPTHWGPGGEPDDWDEKSFGTVFLPPLIGAGTTVMLALCALMVPVFTQPAREPSGWARFRHEGVARATVSVLGWVSLLTALFVGWLSVSGWTTPERIAMRWPLVLYLVALAVFLFQPFRRWRRWSDRQAEEAGFAPTPQEAAEDRLWLPGGIYNNPDEPRVMVPKREGHGTGLTINVGNRTGRAIAIGFVLVIVVLPVALVFPLG